MGLDSCVVHGDTEQTTVCGKCLESLQVVRRRSQALEHFIINKFENQEEIKQEIRDVYKSHVDGSVRTPSQNQSMLLAEAEMLDIQSSALVKTSN